MASYSIKSMEKVLGSKREPPIITSLYNWNNSKVKKVTNKNKGQRLNKLELPTTSSVDDHYIKNCSKLEQLIRDTHITVSSIITSKPGTQIINSGDDPLSTTSHYSQSTDNINIGINEEKSVITSPFDLYWCFGFNPDVPILNLSNNNSSTIVFANSHYAVLYDFHEDRMMFMQGHLNTVTCMSANSTGDIIATADSTSEVGTSRVIVWDRRACVLQVLYNVHLHGCQYVGLSSNGDFLITVSANETPICIKVWEWEKDSKQASASVIVKETLGDIRKLTMNANSRQEFAVTFEHLVIFGNVIWQTVLQGSSLEGKVSESIKDCVFEITSHIPSKLGSFTDTTFLDGDEAIAISSTSKGYVVVWEDGYNAKCKKAYRKYVRLHLDCITNIQTIDNKIAVATASGNVSFYDYGLKILYFHKLCQEPLLSLSFNLTTQRNDVNTCDIHKSCANTWRIEPRKLVDATLKNEPFSIRHFVISTESGKIAYFNASYGTLKYLNFLSKEPFTALDVLPKSNFLCAGTACGQCILFDTDQRKSKVTQQIKVQTNLCQAISFLKYSPKGYILACGMYTGDIWLLDPLLLTPTYEFPLNPCNCCITQILFTPDSDYLIVIDVSFCISVYFLNERPTLIGQYIGHYKTIVSANMDFTDPEDNEIKIFTLSADRHLCQFVIDKKNRSFNFSWNHRVEQTAVPMYSVKYSHPSSSANTYLGANNEYKFKVYDKKNTSLALLVTRMRGMVQAPDFGSPINYMEIFENNGQSYMFLKTKHHIGIHLLPADGNPYRALGFRASPTDLTCCRIHPSGKYVFTISEGCRGISMWKVNTQAVEEFHKSGGKGLEPYLRILGQEKETNIRDFFDLGQFLHQGDNPNIVRTLTNSLPICEVANVLQALGCLLTKHDIAEITSEVVCTDLNNPVYNIEYDDFVRLYFNHRQTVDLKLRDLYQAFRDFYIGVYFTLDSPADLCMAKYDPAFDSESFIQNLLLKGEEITPEELFADFSILTGSQPERLEDGLRSPIPSNMPKKISFKVFVTDILGFDVEDSLFEKYSVQYKNA